MDDVNKEKEVTERSAEEIAWDEEFDSTRGGNDFATTMTDLLALAIKVPIAIVQMPINMLPTDTRRHARAAVREGFMAARSLVSAIGDGLEDMLADPTDSRAPVSGPPGTWGSARYGSQQPKTGDTETGSGKVKRIEFDDEETEEAPPGEGRGLRADIDY